MLLHLAVQVTAEVPAASGGPVADDDLTSRGLWQYAHYYDPAEWVRGRLLPAHGQLRGQPQRGQVAGQVGQRQDLGLELDAERVGHEHTPLGDALPQAGIAGGEPGPLWGNLTRWLAGES